MKKADIKNKVVERIEKNTTKLTTVMSNIRKVEGVSVGQSTRECVADIVTNNDELKQLIYDMALYYYYLGKENALVGVEELF